jgi:hypothetical protein
MWRHGDAPRSHSPSDRDAHVAALIGLLAVLEGELLVDAVDPALAARLRDRCVRAGLLDPGAETSQLAGVLGDLNQRLRQALGEFDEAPD